MNTITRLFFLIGCLACSQLLFAASGAAMEPGAQPDGIKLFREMTEAMRTRSYTGTFVYRDHKQTGTMNIVHKVIDGKEYEKVTSLEGELKEVIRDPAGVRFIFPERKQVFAGVLQPVHLRGVLHRLNVKSHVARSLYSVEILGENRVAGEKVQILDIQPKDTHRYGYRLWIGETHRLPLKFELRDPRGIVVEQIVFTRIQAHNPEDISDDGIYSRFYTKDFDWKPMADMDRRDVGKSHALRIEDVPDGFRLVKREILFSDESGEEHEMTHLLYSDNLAEFSVLVSESGGGMDMLAGHGVAEGGKNVYSDHIKGRRVMVIGEVPEETVLRVGQSIRF